MAGSAHKKRHESNTKFLRIHLALASIVSLLFLTAGSYSLSCLLWYLVLGSPMWLSFAIIKACVKPAFDSQGKLVDCGDVWDTTGAVEYARDVLYVSMLSMLVNMVSTLWGMLLYAAVPCFAALGVYRCIIAPMLQLKNSVTAAQQAPPAPMSRKERRAADKHH
jgi:hypothetical protein